MTTTSTLRKLNNLLLLLAAAGLWATVLWTIFDVIVNGVPS